jgi:hypothetical protein
MIEINGRGGITIARFRCYLFEKNEQALPRGRA